jgi:ParG protein
MTARPQALSEAAEKWVESRPAGKPVATGPTKRLTLDIPEDLHRRFKIVCVQRDEAMHDVIRRLIEQEMATE